MYNVILAVNHQVIACPVPILNQENQFQMDVYVKIIISKKIQLIYTVQNVQFNVDLAFNHQKIAKNVHIQIQESLNLKDAYVKIVTFKKSLQMLCALSVLYSVKPVQPRLKIV